MSAEVKIASLRFEHHPTGLGIPVSKPRLSWKVVPVDAAVVQDWVQEAYEIQVQGATGSDVRSFHVNGSSTVLVPWQDTPLHSAEIRSVRVKSLGSSTAGKSSTEWSEWVTVEAALLDKSDWTAWTISAPLDGTRAKHPDEAGTRPVRLRKTFQVPEQVARSRLYITVLGLYEASLNGQRIGDECLAPGWTSYQHRIQFQVYDVASLLKPGADNTLVIEVAEGWYAGRLIWGEGISNFYGDRIGAVAQLDVYTANGEPTPSLRVETDSTWESRLSPTVASGIYDGEAYDLGLEYDSQYAATDGEQWSPVEVIETPDVELVASSCPPVRVTQTIKPINIFKDPEGKTLVDFGQNLVGNIRIPHLAKPDGHRVVVRYAEVLEHGRLGTRPLREAKATDTIIFGGDKELKDWTPRFTYHGFRYIDITGWGPDDETPLTLESLVAEVMHTDMDRTGYFECSDEKVTQLHKNVVWSMRGNFVGLPTDCPQRDERLGWTGDIQIFSPTASYIYDCGGMLANWMRDLVAEQKEHGGVVPVVVPNALKHGPWPSVPQAVWDDVVILLPWALYWNFGDEAVLRDNWAGMKSYLETLYRGDDGLWDPAQWQLGDWLDPNAPPAEPGLARTDGVLVADEYLVYVTSVMARIGDILGFGDDAQRFREDHARLQQVFEDKYMAKSGLIVGDSQTSLALALVFDLHKDPKQRKMAADRLARLVRFAKFQVSTGFAGTPVILDALTKGGHADIAYRMLLEEGCPSWLYTVRMGGTTTWERWDSMLEDGSINPGQMTSFNHYALGSVAGWLHGTVGGLAPREAGWRVFTVRPRPGGTLRSASMRFESRYGEVAFSWRLRDGGERDGDEAEKKEEMMVVLDAKLVVPPNARAVVERPDGTVVKEVGSGAHELSWAVEGNGGKWPPRPLLTEFRD